MPIVLILININHTVEVDLGVLKYVSNCKSGPSFFPASLYMMCSLQDS